MGNSRSSLQLQQENIEQISEETGCKFYTFIYNNCWISNQNELI